MPDLNFQVENARPVEFAAAPLVALILPVRNRPPEQIQSVALRCPIQIEATRRRYNPQEQARLVDLFGQPERWSPTLRACLWTHASVVVPPFIGSTSVDLQV